MSTQSEAVLEESLIKQLVGLEYEKVTIKDDKWLEVNLKLQLEKHNKFTMSDSNLKEYLII